MRKHNLRDNAGSAFVELALVLPLLCLILIGSVELGRLAYAAIEVSNAARAAVAFSSQNHSTAGQDAVTTAAVQQVAAADAADLTMLGATLKTTPETVCVCVNGSTSNTISDCTQLGNLCCPPGETANCVGGYTGTGVVYVQAYTTATLNTIFRYPGLPTSFSLHGFAQMRVLN